MSVVVEGRNREEIGTALQFTAVQGLAGPQGRESVVQPLTCQQIPTVLTGSHRQPQKAVRDKRGGAYS